MTTLSTRWTGRASAVVPMLNVGDSVSEGTGASAFENKWTTLLLRALQTDAGISGGPGLLNPGSFSPGSNDLSSHWSPVGSVQQTGFLRSASWSNDQAITFTFTGTSFSLHFFKGFPGATNFTITIDGGSPITVTVPSTGGQNNQGVYTSATLSHASHTVVMTPAAGAAINVRGVHVYDGDEGKGIHGWEGGRYGSSTATHVSNLSSWYSDAVTVIQPAVCTLFLGLNDESSNVVPSTFQANLESIITGINALCTTAPSWVIAGPFERSSSWTYPTTDYQAAVAAVAATDATNRRAIDLTTVTIPTTDGTHPTDSGHAIIAAKFETAILDLAGVSGPPSSPGAWSNVLMERWSGSAWVPVIAERWSGSAWVTVLAERAN